MKNKAEPHQFAKYKRTNTESHAETREEKKEIQEREVQGYDTPLPPEEAEDKISLAMVARRPLSVLLALALATAAAATGVSTARGITPQRTRQTTPPPYHRPRTIGTTAVLISLKSGPKPCPCAPTCRNISRPSRRCRGASCSLNFLIFLFLILPLFLSSKSGRARG